MNHFEMLIGGHFVGGPCDQSVAKTVSRTPWTGAVIGTAAEASWAECEMALIAAHEAKSNWQATPCEDRSALLKRISSLIRERKGELAQLLVDEVGKPISFARAEVDRIAITFELSAEAALSSRSFAADLSYDPRGVHFSAEVMRVPRGAVFGIVPYNWPFNLAAHKLGPALASGNTIILKGSPLSPLCHLALARIFADAGTPDGVANFLLCEPREAERIAGDPRIDGISFTGSPAVGWHLKERFPKKPIWLELGGNAFAVVASKTRDDLWEILAKSAFGYAGQICISLQHLLIHESLYEAAVDALIDSTNQIACADPTLEDTICGPMIHEQAAQKAIYRIAEAARSGATILAGSNCTGNRMSPTLLSDVPLETELMTEEIFAPVLTIEPYSNLGEAIGRINASTYGIHASLFSADEDAIQKFARECHVGGVVINDAPTIRFDSLPYGGVRESGFGREGISAAIREFTEEKSVVRRKF